MTSNHSLLEPVYSNYRYSYCERNKRSSENADLQVILAYAVFASTDMNLFFNELTRPFIFQICKEKQARGGKTFSMLNSAEHEIYPAHKC